MQSYTTTSEVVARLVMLEREVQALLATIQTIRTDLLGNGVIMDADDLEHNQKD